MKARIIVAKGSARCRGCSWGKWGMPGTRWAKPKPIPKGEQCLEIQHLDAGPPGTMYAYYCEKHALEFNERLEQAIEVLKERKIT